MTRNQGTLLSNRIEKGKLAHPGDFPQSIKRIGPKTNASQNRQIVLWLEQELEKENEISMALVGSISYE